VARRSRLLIGQVVFVGVVAAFAFASDGSAYVGSASVTLTASGPTPATSTINAGTYLAFVNKDSVTHTVVFANGLCSLSVSPGEAVGPDNSINGSQLPDCNSDFPLYVGSYAYTMDGKFPGTVNTSAGRRAVTLTARSHRIRPGARLRLHGLARWDDTATPTASRAPFPVIVLAHEAGSPGYRVIARVTMKGLVDTRDVWHLRVRPVVATTYIAELTGQLPGGTIWKPAKSRHFTIRMRP
jgi:plastocyanin